MEVSIIIVNYNTKQLLKECIHSVYDQTVALDFEIIVVDNASADGSQEMIKNDFPNVILIESKDNLGFGNANNEGAKLARGKYIFLLNSDTLLINNAVCILANFLDENPKAGICGGNLYKFDLTPATSFSQMMPGVCADIDYFFWGLFSRIRHKNNLHFNFTEHPMKINGHLSGADLMIRKDIFLKINGFDPDFFMYYEETELIYRVRGLNYEIFSVPQAKIVHLEGASEGIKERTAVRSFQSKFMYYDKTGMSNKKFLSHFLFKLTAIQRLLIFTVLGKKEKITYWKNLFKWESETYKSKSTL